MAVVHATFGKTADERAEEEINAALQTVAKQILSGNLTFENYQRQAGFFAGLEQAEKVIKEARRNKGDD